MCEYCNHVDKKQLKKNAKAQALLEYQKQMVQIAEDDKKWFAEMAIPRKELDMVGERIEPGVPWTIFFGRYNFTRYLPWKENSCFPHIKPFNYHYYEKFATLKMIKLESEEK